MEENRELLHKVFLILEKTAVPIPGTTKLSHLEENLRTLDFNISSGEWKELEDTVTAIPVVGDWYNAE